MIKHHSDTFFCMSKYIYRFQIYYNIMSVVTKRSMLMNAASKAATMMGLNMENNTISVPRVTHEYLENHVMDTYKDSPDYSINNVNGYGEIEIPTLSITSKGIAIDHHRGDIRSNRGPFNVVGRALLVTDLVNPYSNNNIIARTSRFLNEELYIISNTLMEKINTVCIIAALVIAIIIWYRSYILDLTQIYVFKKDLDIPEDRAQDYETLEKLRQYMDLPGVEILNETLTARLKDLVNRNASKVHDAESLSKLKEYNETLNSRNMYYAKLALSIVPGIVAVWSIFKRTSVHRDSAASTKVVYIGN